MAEFEQAMRTLALLGIAAVLVLFLVRAWWGWRTRSTRNGHVAATIWIRLAQLLRITALALFGGGALAWLFVLQRGTVFMPPTLQAALAFLLVVYLLLELALAVRPRSRAAAWRHALGIVATLGVAALGVPLSLAAVRAFAYPAAEDGAVLARLPFEGEWAVIGAGATAATNHHDRIASQKYAADMAAVCGDGRLFRGGGVSLAESCTFGAPVLSPVDGTVVHVLDGLADGASREVLPGNHVVIRFGANRYVALAHFRQGSVRVKQGERVRAGQAIARAGNSGNTDFPHLHLHVQDTPEYDIRRSRAIPYRFARMERRRWLWWSRVRDGVLLSNDRVRPAP